MTLVSGIVVYLLVWWLVLFTVLPWGNRPEDKPAEGHAPSAPALPRLGLKFLVTTIFATILWLAVYLFVEWAPVDLYAEAEKMFEEDRR